MLRSADGACNHGINTPTHAPPNPPGVSCADRVLLHGEKSQLHYAHVRFFTYCVAWKHTMVGPTLSSRRWVVLHGRSAALPAVDPLPYHPTSRSWLCQIWRLSPLNTLCAQLPTVVSLWLSCRSVVRQASSNRLGQVKVAQSPIGLWAGLCAFQCAFSPHPSFERRDGGSH